MMAFPEASVPVDMKGDRSHEGLRRQAQREPHEIDEGEGARVDRAVARRPR